MEGLDVESIVKQAVKEYEASMNSAAAAYMQEVRDLRHANESLRRRVDELVLGQRNTGDAIDDLALRVELQRQNVVDVDLAVDAMRGERARADERELTERLLGRTITERVGSFLYRHSLLVGIREVKS